MHQLRKKALCSSYTFVLMFLAFLYCFTLNLTHVAFADDGAEYTGDPRFKLVPPGKNIEVLAAKLRLTGNVWDIHYTFRNAGSNAERMTILFEIPDCTYSWSLDAYPDRSYSDLKLFFNDKEVQYERSSKAYLNGRDVTQILAQFNIQPNDVNDPAKWEERLETQGVKQLSALQKQGIVDKDGLPQWVAKNVYSSTFSIEYDERVTVRYTYSSLPGFAFLEKPTDSNPTNAYTDEILGRVGIDWQQMTTMYGGKNRNQRMYSFVWFDLPLWAEDWQKGLDLVTVEITPDKAQNGSPMVVSRVNNELHAKKKQLSISYKRLQQTGTIPILMVSPTSWE